MGMKPGAPIGGATPGIGNIPGVGSFWIKSEICLSSHLFLLLRLPGRRLALRLGRDGQRT